MNYSEAGKLGWLRSKETHEKRKQERINEYNKNPKKCKHCGKILSYDNRYKMFCNSSCAASFNNANRVKKDYGFCKVCGKVLKVKNSKYCSNKCQGIDKKNQFLIQWKEGKKKGYLANGQISPFIKNYLLTKVGYKCEKCGWGEINPHTGKIPLEIHHIDGDWKNNKEENLQVLCPNCHSLTPTYKASNKGKGRKNNPKFKLD